MGVALSHSFSKRAPTPLAVLLIFTKISDLTIYLHQLFPPIISLSFVLHNKSPEELQYKMSCISVSRHLLEEYAALLETTLRELCVDYLTRINLLHYRAFVYCTLHINVLNFPQRNS